MEQRSKTRSGLPRLPNRLWKYRQRRALTQWQVAKLLGYASRTRISEYEHGGRMPSLVTALKLGIIYRVPVEFLFADLRARLATQLREREEGLRDASAGRDAETPAG